MISRRTPADLTVGVVLALVITAATAFLALPILAIFLRVPPSTLVHDLRSPVVRDALRLTLETNAIAIVLLIVFGTPTAYLLATRRFPGRNLVLTLFELPLVLPPAVAGIGLLAAFGRTGLLGGALGAFGWQLPFTTAAVVIAELFVSSPFYLRAAVSAFAAVDADLVSAARTLGASPSRAFWRVALPLAAGGLGAGTATALARGVGEFGATIMFAGNFQGITQTLPLAIYEEFESSFDVALSISALLVVVSAAILLTVKLVPAWIRFRSTSQLRSAASRSR